MSDTPRTDAIAHRGFHLDVLVAKAIDLCRELERENATLRSALDYQANYQRELRQDRDRLDWLLTADGGEWVNWMYDIDEWTPELKASRDAIDSCREVCKRKRAKP
jgi:hypothetical protein